MGQISLQLPQIGQPNSTEDPKIISDLTVLQTVINGNLDQSNVNLSAGFYMGTQKTATVNTTAAPGDWWIVRPGVTLTLPPATQNAVITVTGDPTVSGTAPATIAGAGIFRSNGTTITSFVLGAVATVVLAGDGAGHWYMRAGAADSGWVPLTLAGGVFTAYSAPYIPAVRVQGDIVRLRGGLTTASGTFAWATLPAVAWPAQNTTVAPTTGTSTGPVNEPVTITTAGDFQVGGAPNGTIFLDGITYALI